MTGNPEPAEGVEPLGWVDVEAEGVRLALPVGLVETPPLTPLWSLRQFQDGSTGLVVSVYRRPTTYSGSFGVEGLARSALGPNVEAAVVLVAESDRWEVSATTAHGDPSVKRVVALRQQSGEVVIAEIVRPVAMDALDPVVSRIAASISVA